MKTSSCKAKGRSLQKWLVENLTYIFNLEEGDCTSRSMGAGGEDVLISPIARGKIGASFECKNMARFSIYKYYAQAKGNASKYEPILIIKQNRSTPLAVVDAEWLLNLMAS